MSNPYESGIKITIKKNATKDITKKVQSEKITRTSIVIIGDVVKPKSYEFSRLYDKSFSHGYRKAKIRTES